MANFSIRGYGITSTIPSVEPSVGTLLDGVYLGNNFAVIADFFDIDTVEVVRGPQGVLFGRNVTAGAVLINSARPEDEFHAKFSGRWEKGLDQTYKAVVTGPLSDSLSGRMAMYYRDDAGWFEDEFDGEALGKSETVIIRPSITFSPGEDWSHTLLFEYLDIDGDGSITQHSGHFSGHDVSLDPTVTKVEGKRVMLESTWDVAFGNGTVTNIFGWRDIDVLVAIDADSGLSDLSNLGLVPFPFPSFNFFNSMSQEQFSNELRYNGGFGDFDVTAGGYYFSQDVYTGVGFEFNGQFVPGGRQGPNAGKLDHSAWGVFAQVDYNISHSWIFSAGLRYSAEDKDAAVSPAFLGACSNPDVRRATTTCTRFFDVDDDWSFLSPKVGISWFVNDDALLYAHYAKGVRSGGFNLRQTIGLQDAMGNVIGSEPVYDEESHHSYELGLKSEFNDGRTRLNAAVFYSDVKDLQFQALFDDDNDPSTPGTAQVTSNAGDAEMYGVELELRHELVRSLIADVNFGWLEAELKNVGSDVTDFKNGMRPTRSPEISLSVNLTHEMNFGQAGQLVTRATYHHRDKFFTETLEGGVPVIVPKTDQFHLFFTWYSGNGNWAVSAYARNLSNEVINNSAQMPNSVLRIDAIGEGRTFGGEIQYEF